MITDSIFKALFPSARQGDFVTHLNTLPSRFQINTPLRMAAFLAQVGHECGGFRVFEENLNYSAEALTKTFPRHFPSLTEAQSYARKPEMIANRVYANRMGNGPESSGDGWRWRGRGAIQLTGKDNNTAFAAAIKMSLDKVDDYLLTPEGAVISAGWFWSKNGCNPLADQANTRTGFEALTRRINGGLIGLEDRLKKFDTAKAALGVR